MPRPVGRGYLADPHVFRHDGRYFAIGTSTHHANAAGIAYREPDGAAFGLYESTDFNLDHWVYRGGLLAPLAEPQHWAPEVVVTPDGEVYRDRTNQIWCFFSAGTDQEHWIYLATSPDMHTRFVVKQRITRGTDPHPHFDESGALCLLYAMRWEEPGSCIVGAHLGPDLSLDGAPKRLLAPTAPWMAADAYRIVEGPFVQRIGNLNYLLFSGGSWQANYGLDYAVSDRLLGHYEYDAAISRPRLLQSDASHGIVDPGHCTAVEVDSGLYIAHQQWTDCARNTRVAVLRRLTCTAGALTIADL